MKGRKMKKISAYSDVGRSLTSLNHRHDLRAKAKTGQHVTFMLSSDK